MRKKFIVMIAVVMMILSSTVLANQEVIEVKLNDKYIDFTDSEGNRVDPELINDRTMVPMRKIFETLGADVEWDGATESVTAKTDAKEIVLQINNNEAKVRNLETGKTETIILDSAPVILNDRTMVPVRFIAESLDKQVGWDGSNQVVVIIDYDEILNRLNKNCSTFMEMAQGQTVKLDSIDITSNVKGTLAFKDKSDSKNNQQVTVTGTIDFKQSTDSKVEIECDFKLSAKGDLQKQIKEQGFDKIKANVILDANEGALYFSSSFNDNQWIKYTQEELKDLLPLKDNNTEVDLKEVIGKIQDNVTKDTYENLIEVVKIVELLFGNDKVTVSGSSSKTYTIKWDLNDILSELQLKDDFYDSESLSSRTNAKATIAITYNAGMNTKNKFDIEIDVLSLDETEEVVFNVSSDTKVKSYNKDVEITLPKNYEEVNSLGFMNTPNNAKFAAFCQEYDRIQTEIQLNYYYLYMKYATDTTLTVVPTHYDIYKEIATGIPTTNNNESEWVKITNFDNTYEYGMQPTTYTGNWYLRTNDGKLAYEGFERGDGDIYYTPNRIGTTIVNSFNDDIIN